uniref:Uncharacterized protein n=1 Tax=Picea glauca TaxID=3330 RepID=A0A101LZU4_PICGL|nr:hypothetical protein ABT39_MTgene5302 [Picea glauca]QHR88875.1 hypothetical protein Q903MT_gene2894 [Picea sitchensis]
MTTVVMTAKRKESINTSYRSRYRPWSYVPMYRKRNKRALGKPQQPSLPLRPLFQPMALPLYLELDPDMERRDMKL